MIKKSPPPPPRVIEIDVDGTLLNRNGTINLKVSKFAQEKSKEGFEVWLWSSRGESHARRISELAGLNDVFTHILSKPGYVVDDQGWRWIRYTKVICEPDDL